MSTPIQHERLSQAARRLTAARRLVVITGAGVSKESGIATVRDAADALWDRYDAMDMATKQGYLRDPEYVWAWYEHRFGLIERSEPNPGHYAIASMEQLVPQLTVITQNIDGLHQRAGSRDVLELHGSAHRFRCLEGCERGRQRTYSHADLADQTARPPRCPFCGGLMRPDVVWFGEQLDEEVLARAFESADSCDAMLVIGTSGVVQPAASLPVLAKRAHAAVIDVNPERDEVAMLADIFLQGPGGEALPRLLAGMLEEAAQNGVPL